MTNHKHKQTMGLDTEMCMCKRKGSVERQRIPERHRKIDTGSVNWVKKGMSFEWKSKHQKEDRPYKN